MENIYIEDVEFVADVVSKGFAYLRRYQDNAKQLIHTIEYRMKRANSDIINVQRNTSILNIDKQNYPSITVSLVTDITCLCTSSFRPKSVFYNPYTKEKHYFKTKEIQNDFTISKREVEVLKLLCEGLSSKQIAEKLFISKHTVDGHRRMLLKKTQMTTTTELISFSYKHQLIDY